MTSHLAKLDQNVARLEGLLQHREHQLAKSKAVIRRKEAQLQEIADEAQLVILRYSRWPSDEVARDEYESVLARIRRLSEDAGAMFPGHDKIEIVSRLAEERKAR